MSKEELKTFARDFLSKLEPDHNGAKVVGLKGDLGAGKTTFTQICAELMGITENVTSPTFVILKKYETDRKFFGEKFPVFVHIDAYRLKGAEELNTVGWKDIIKDPKNLIFVEWPELVSEAMPQNTIYLNFEHVDEENRKITHG